MRDPWACQCGRLPAEPEFGGPCPGCGAELRPPAGVPGTKCAHCQRVSSHPIVCQGCGMRRSVVDERKGSREAGTLLSRYLLWKDEVMPSMKETRDREHVKDPAFMDAVVALKKTQDQLHEAPDDVLSFMRCVLVTQRMLAQFRRLGSEVPDVPPPVGGLEGLYAVLSTMEE